MGEQRTIMVANTKTQKRYKISTNASTLGELKSVLHDNGIDYTDMAFTEGITKSVLTDDNAPLPANIPYKGNTTNNLVLLLTNTSKKIASGLSGERLSAYQEVKENELEQAVKDAFGRNFTQVSTEDLCKFLESNRKKSCIVGTVLEEEDMECPDEDEEEAGIGCSANCSKTPSEDYIKALRAAVGKLREAEDIINDLLFELL